MDAYTVFKNVRISEKAYRLIEDENKLTINVDPRANKFQIKEAVEKLLGVTILKVNTYNTPRGEKHAIVQLSDNDIASDVAANMGVI